MKLLDFGDVLKTSNIFLVGFEVLVRTRGVQFPPKFKLPHRPLLGHPKLQSRQQVIFARVLKRDLPNTSQGCYAFTLRRYVWSYSRGRRKVTNTGLGLMGIFQSAENGVRNKWPKTCLYGIQVAHVYMYLDFSRLSRQIIKKFHRDLTRCFAIELNPCYGGTYRLHPHGQG